MEIRHISKKNKLCNCCFFWDKCFDAMASSLSRKLLYIYHPVSSLSHDIPIVISHDSLSVLYSFALEEHKLDFIQRSFYLFLVRSLIADG